MSTSTGLDLSTVSLPISPSPDARAFWEACTEGRLVLPHCDACGESFFYPRSTCPSCGSRALSWRDASGRGVVHAFCIHHHSSLGFLQPLLPFVTALVRLEEGPTIMALLDAPADPASVRCDMPVEATFCATADGTVVPVFVPRRNAQIV
jgi:uncharacterized OB-fold protein